MPQSWPFPCLSKHGGADMTSGIDYAFTGTVYLGAILTEFSMRIRLGDEHER